LIIKSEYLFGSPDRQFLALEEIIQVVVFSLIDRREHVVFGVCPEVGVSADAGGGRGLHGDLNVEVTRAESASS
jgi:hypothetical protein